MALTLTRVILISIGCVSISIGLGVIIGYFSAKSEYSITDEDSEKLEYFKSLIKEDDASFRDEIVKDMNAEKIRDHLKLIFNLFKLIF